MDLSSELSKLPPEALDILRFFGRQGSTPAHTEDIIEGAGLTERSFGKGIRRLVTKMFVAMDGEQVYRLTERGKPLVAELLEFDLMAPPEDKERAARSEEPRFIRRRAVLVAPRLLTAGQPTNIYVGLDEADEDELVMSPLNVLLRVEVLNGEPREARESSLLVENRGVQQVFEITPGYYTQSRVRVQVCQPEDDVVDLEACGGLYVDLPVSPTPANAPLTAFGADLMLKDTSGDGDDLAETDNDYDDEA